ncbi:MAG: HlyD family efflux transporter periplasmic adaptor subunit [Desulfobulbaceae bacterium]|nr:HlyD family efflux transporter periplasmic adaptor subunit [Desulfobulbaceae bacterium]
MPQPISALFRILLAYIFTLVLFSCDLGANRGKQDALLLYGNVDIREVQLAFQDGGKIASVLVEEGASVSPGQLLAELEPERFALEVRRLQGEVAAQAEALKRLQTGSRTQEVLQAQAAVAAARATLHEAKLVLDRKTRLYTSNHIAKQEVDSARAREQTAQAALKSAQEGLSLAEEGARQEDIAAAEAALASVQAALALAEKRLVDSRLLAPAQGIIRSRILEPGALAGPGAPVFTLALSEPLWVRTYITEPDLGRIREGMPAQVYSDSFPEKNYRGWVGFIASTAEFTPKTVETTELRTKLVYQARIMVCNDQHELRLGMPVTVRIERNAQPVALGADPCGQPSTP